MLGNSNFIYRTRSKHSSIQYLLIPALQPSQVFKLIKEMQILYAKFMTNSVFDSWGTQDPPHVNWV